MTKSNLIDKNELWNIVSYLRYHMGSSDASMHKAHGDAILSGSRTASESAKYHQGYGDALSFASVTIEDYILGDKITDRFKDIEPDDAYIKGRHGESVGGS